MLISLTRRTWRGLKFLVKGVRDILIPPQQVDMAWADPIELYNQLTNRSCVAIKCAIQVAADLHHDYIGPEHLLVGLFDEERGLAATTLKSIHLERGRLLDAVLEVSPPNEVHGTPQPLLFTAQTKQGFTCAAEAAGCMGHPYIGTEHLLLGLLQVPESPAVKTLSRLGIVSSDIQARIVVALQISAPGTAPTAQLTTPVSHAPPSTT